MVIKEATDGKNVPVIRFIVIVEMKDATWTARQDCAGGPTLPKLCGATIGLQIGKDFIELHINRDQVFPTANKRFMFEVTTHGDSFSPGRALIFAD